MPPTASITALAAFGLPRTTREGSGLPRAASIKEERSSSSSSSSDANSSAGGGGTSGPAPVRPLSIDTGANAPTLSVKDIVAKTESHTQQREGVRQTSIRELKFFTVAKGLVRTALSPRSRAASTDVRAASNNNTDSNDTGALSVASHNTAAVPTATSTTGTTTTGVSSKKLSHPTTGFGKFRRANTSAPALSKNAAITSPSTAVREQRSIDPKPHSTPQQLSVGQQSRSFRAGAESDQSSGSESDARKDNRDRTDDTAAGAPQVAVDVNNNDKPAPQEAAGLDFVDDVRETLDQLVQQLDGVDPKKLYAIRLGGELRGLLGKAQDEFGAYESAFVEHAQQVGVAVALQNFSASLAQVFAIVARLQSAKALFLLNKNFKREVLFAFQEINSYYTSLFMELAMAVAKRSGIVLPLPSSVKPQLSMSPVEEPLMLPVEEPPVEQPPVKIPTPPPPEPLKGE